MATPEGLRTPRRILFLIPIAVVLIGLATAAFLAWLHLAQQAGHPLAHPPAPPAGSATKTTNFQPEILYGVGVLILFLALAYGAWRYHTRNRANDKVTEAATRESYEHPDRYPAERKEFEKRIRPS